MQNQFAMLKTKTQFASYSVYIYGLVDAFKLSPVE